MKRFSTTIIVRHESEKGKSDARPGKPGQFLSTASVGETSPAGQPATLSPKRKAHNLERGVIPIRAWPASAGLWTNLAIAASLPSFPVPNHGCHATCAPGGRPSLDRSSFFDRKVTIFKSGFCFLGEHNLSEDNACVLSSEVFQ